MLNKFKAWIIHKLGGIVVADLPKPLPVKKKEVHIIDIHASGIFTDCLVRDEAKRERFERYKCQRLADGLAQQILEQGLATVTTKPVNRELYADQQEVTATAYLIREEDARMENCDAVTFKRELSYEEVEQLFKQRPKCGTR